MSNPAYERFLRQLKAANLPAITEEEWRAQQAHAPRRSDRHLKAKVAALKGEELSDEQIAAQLGVDEDLVCSCQRQRDPNGNLLQHDDHKSADARNKRVAEKRARKFDRRSIVERDDPHGGKARGMPRGE